MRVAMLINKYLPALGGAERQVSLLSAQLARLGAEVHVLTRPHGACPAFEVADGVHVHRMPRPPFRGAASPSFTVHALFRLFRIRPDIVHAHDLLSCATTAMLAKRLLGVPIVATAHGSGLLGDIRRLGRKPLSRERLSAMRREIDSFIVISNDIDRELAEQGILADRRVKIANSIDAGHFRPADVAGRQAARQALGIEGGPVAVFTGRLIPEKRVHTLISLWPQIRQTHPAASLLIVGTGPEEARLRAEGSPGVVFCGATDDVRPFLQASDVFILPSAAEGLSISLLEALASGLAVVATDVGGARDVIAPEIEGLLIEPDDPGQLRDAILRVFGDAPLRARLGAAARARVAKDYDVGACSERLLAFYQGLVGRSSPSRPPVRRRQGAAGGHR